MRTLRTNVVIRSATGLNDEGNPISLIELLCAQFPNEKRDCVPALLHVRYGIRLTRHSSEKDPTAAGATHLNFRYTLHLPQDPHDVSSDVKIREGLEEALGRWSGDMPEFIRLSTVKHVLEWTTMAKDFVHIHTYADGRSVRTWDQVGASLLFLGMVGSHLGEFVTDCRNVGTSTDDRYAKTLWSRALGMHTRYAAFLHKVAQGVIHV